MNLVEWPCSPGVFIAQWIQHPPSVWEVMVWRFFLCHMLVRLINSPFHVSLLSLRFLLTYHNFKCTLVVTDHDICYCWNIYLKLKILAHMFCFEELGGWKRLWETIYTCLQNPEVCKKSEDAMLDYMYMYAMVFKFLTCFIDKYNPGSRRLIPKFLVSYLNSDLLIC